MIQYKVRPVTRFMVTRFESKSNSDSGSSTQVGIYDNFDTAYSVGYALCSKEHADAGTPPGDPNFQYPSTEPPQE